ncbi:MAG TPA: pyruvate:ferredoxin (flavodoxin) oxidoreductase [Acidimicrobiia bacterium]|nr:pyruvate:ferredoxin (flavodoxin) oxidoreductase [Acidimicrobiia bacterium]
MKRPIVTVDGNEAASYVAHKLSEVIAIYPITPSSTMGENADDWSAAGRTNIWGTIPDVVEMQSEAGAAAACHGAIQSGALTTTFTASQGLLLMIPTMYKVAGELSCGVIHVSARTLATHALSIFGDHSDVMGVRQTGFALLTSASVQEAHDLAAVAHSATLTSRLPFLHFFDGFRTSSEVAKIEMLTDDDLRAMIDPDALAAHRARALDPERPVLRGSAQNPDVFFQAREASNPFFDAVPAKVQEAMDRLGALVGRHYHLFDYVGDPEAERVVILMGSAIGAAEETMRTLREDGEKVGLLKVRLYRPFDAGAFLAALPKTVKGIAVLDRTKEPGALGEPLYQDVVTVLAEAAIAGTLPLPGLPRVIGGRYGLSSKEFTPAMAKAVFDELKVAEPKRHFTVGIEDDVTHLSLDYDPDWHPKAEREVRALFYGLGSDGTVGANKNSVKIIGESTPMFAQGYFVYDSKKSGSTTASHLRFGPERIEGSYLIDRAGFVACHDFGLLERVDVLGQAERGAIFLLNSPYGTEEVWERLPVEVQRQIIDRNLKFYVVDGYAVAEAAGLGRRVNTVLQTCFFALSKILPPDEAIREIKAFIKKSYGRRGEAVLKRNYDAVDASLAALHQVEVPTEVAGDVHRLSPVPADAPEFVHKVTAEIIAGRGDLLPVSAFPPDGTFPTGTTKYEKRSIALEIPIWDQAICIDCARCALVCPHAAIRIKYYDPAVLNKAPEGFLSREPKGKDFSGMLLTVQVAPEDCTGCGVCVSICPAKSKEEVKHKAINMEPKDPHLARERERFDFFLTIPEVDRATVDPSSLKGSQALLPLFEYSGACAGCGETPYIKLASQLFGDRMLIGNATGCTSIYGGNLPTTPWAKTADGKGPAWSNSLFEDAAEFAFGMRLAADQKMEAALAAVKGLAGVIGDDLVKATVEADQTTEQGIYEQRARVAAIRERLGKEKSPEAQWARGLLDSLVRKSIWGMGGDGWAYDIGFGGLDHVLASGRDINLLVLDTEVYSNTGGQASKATYRGAVARFASGGKPTAKKDLGLIAMSYGNVYVAQVGMGANMTQTVKAFVEAESYRGPSLIIAYSPCIAHGIDMAEQMDHQKEAAASGYLQLYRYDPRLAADGGNPLQLDSRPATIPVREFTMKEARFAMLTRSNPERAEELAEAAQQDAVERRHLYEALAAVRRDVPEEDEK